MISQARELRDKLLANYEVCVGIRVGESQELSPREFCRKIFGLEGLSKEKVLEAELEKGYRDKCIELLSQVTNKKRRVVVNWGADVEFSKCPKVYRRFFWLFWELYKSRQELLRLRRFVN